MWFGFSASPRRLFTAAIFIVSLIKASAQSVPTDRPFGLKADILGESIDVFRSNNAQVVQYHDNSYSHKLLVKHFPICTNDPTPVGDEPTSAYNSDFIDILVPEKEAKAGVLYCAAGSLIADWQPPGSTHVFAEVNHPTIAGFPARNVRYQFWKGNLYAIDVLFAKRGFQDVLLALKTKYGEPRTSEPLHFQNGFGAQIETQHFVWTNAVSTIEMTELPSGYMDHLTITLDSAVKDLDQMLTPRDGDKDL